MLFGSGIFLLYLTMLHQVIKDGESHVWTQCRCSISQQQSSMHRLTNLTALDYQCRLYALADADQMMMHRADCQQ